MSLATRPGLTPWTGTTTHEHREGELMTAWPTGIHAITLVVEDVAVAKEFYERAFGLPLAFEDADSAVFRFGDTLVNLLAAPAAVELVEPAAVGGAEVGPRMQLTVRVDDVDALCAVLTSRGIQLLNGPMDRPWGVRTASFRNPGGHVWEIAH